ncbi:TolC family outer membrane protein [Marinobacter sp. JSM 1782161]|uniref:TolC family outer membrane protein n=1 Tax=Marinobacter sp. JSM 1782161 TaxID=2685906 RepID=UPI00140312FD|nr:TolC family outer membrane protein [Marinobacter sp. JSM 1782161]
MFACSLAGAAGAQTLEEAVAAAVDSNPGLGERFARYRSVLEDREAVTSEYLPQVSVRAGIGPEHTEYSSGQLIDEDLTRSEASLSVSQLLFNGFETSANSDRLEYEADAERLQLLAEAEDLALATSQVYLDVRKAEELVELTERHVRGHLEILDDVRNLASRGYANEADIAQVSARLANARASLVAANNNYQDARARFLRLVDQAPVNLKDPVTDDTLLPDTVTQAIDWARQTHPQLQAAFADIRAAKEEVEASQSGYYPRLSLEGYATTGEDIGGFEGREEDYRLMLVMEYDLYNGGRDKARSRSSNWRYNEALAVRERTEKDLVEGTRLSWNAYQALNDQRALVQQSVDASTLAETAYITQFRLGKRSLLDLLNAKVEVFIARRTYINTRYDQLQARYRVLNATGRLGYALRLNYPDEWNEANREDSE